MAADRRVLFLSIRPKYAGLILDGRKTVELRRVRPKVAHGDLVLLYASSPTCELVGAFTVDAVEVSSPTALWKRHGSALGVTRSQLYAYFTGTSRAVAISVKDPRRIRHPRTLADLRSQLPGFVPPQSYVYLDADQVAALDITFEPVRREQPMRMR